MTISVLDFHMFCLCLYSLSRKYDKNYLLSLCSESSIHIHIVRSFFSEQSFRVLCIICVPLWQTLQKVQYRHLIPAPIDRTSVSTGQYEHPWIACQIISQAHQWPTSLANRSYVQLWGHPYIHAQETGWQLGVRSCIMTGLVRI